MLNDIFYFITDSERKLLKEKITNKELKGEVVILKQMKTSAKGFNELLVIKTKDELIELPKEEGFFDKLAIDRPYEVTIERI